MFKSLIAEYWFSS